MRRAFDLEFAGALPLLERSWLPALLVQRQQRKGGAGSLNQANLQYLELPFSITLKPLRRYLNAKFCHQ
jgi:hypothetical protein